MRVSILSIGDEVINGKTINTNAAYLSKELELYDLTIGNHLVCIDDCQEIIKGLDFLYHSADVVITTGGLGPTVDDLTKECIADYFNEPLVINEGVLLHIENLFKKINLTTPATNKKQAYFIKNSKVIDNDNGTAPGMIFEKDNKIIIVLPGPPNELKPMFESIVIPYLSNLVQGETFIKRYRLMNIGESHLDEIIGFMYKKYSQIKMAPYASVGNVDFIIKAKKNKELFESACSEFESLLEDYIIGDWSKTIKEIVVDSLTKRNLSIATAESCTGGLVAASIVDVPGSSKVFNEGFVTYSNESKIKRLGISKDTLKQYGAVSEQTAKEMAERVAKLTNSDIGLSTTGIAGPTGGTKEKPVGLVYMGIHYKDQTVVIKKQFGGNREKVRIRTTLSLLYYLYNEFLKTL